jgi:opacity protein-like surface antigen
MKHKLLGMALALFLLAPAASAQVVYGSPGGPYGHGEVGAFLNYTRLHNANDTNFFGLGGRIGFNVASYAQIEFEGANDFRRNVDTQIDLGNGTFITSTSHLRLAHFLAGPRFKIGASGPVNVFVTLKGGLINFSGNANFGAQVANIPSGNTDGVFYPGGGIEFFARWLGARFEAGDEIYFDHGWNHNVRVTAGPVFRF